MKKKNKKIARRTYIRMPFQKKKEQLRPTLSTLWKRPKISTQLFKHKDKIHKRNTKKFLFRSPLKPTQIQVKLKKLKTGGGSNLGFRNIKQKGGNTYVEFPGKKQVLNRSPCNSGTSSGLCSDAEYLSILSAYGDDNGQTSPIRNKLLMRLFTDSYTKRNNLGIEAEKDADQKMSSIMPYIEIILDGIHDFKKYFTKYQFTTYCNAIDQKIFPYKDCGAWLQDMYDVFDEDNLFVPFVKTNSDLLIKNGSIFRYDETRADIEEEHKNELINLFLERDILDGLIYDAGRGLSHIRDLPNKDKLGKCHKGDDDSNIDPKLTKVINTIACLIDPAGNLSLKEDNFTTLEIDQNLIYEGYFAFMEKYGVFIRFYPYKDECNKVRFAICVQSEKQNNPPNLTYDGYLDLKDKKKLHLAEQGIFLCNTQTKSTFTINNIKQTLHALQKSKAVSIYKIDKAQEAYKLAYKLAKSKDPILFVFFWYLVKKTEEKQIAEMFKLLPRLAFTFKLIGDRGQAWVVWFYNKFNDKKLILVTGDRMLMIFAISIGIPAVWSAQGKEYGINYYFFPENENFNLEIQDFIAPAPSEGANNQNSHNLITQYLENYYSYSVLEFNGDPKHLDRIYMKSNKIVDEKQLEKIYNRESAVELFPLSVLQEIMYDSCWKFISNSIDTQELNDNYANKDFRHIFNLLFKFLDKGFGGKTGDLLHLNMDPSPGREVKALGINKNGLQQKTFGTYYKDGEYNTEEKKKSYTDFWKRFMNDFNCKNLQQFVNRFIEKFTLNPGLRSIAPKLNKLFNDSGLQNKESNTKTLSSYIFISMKEHILKITNKMIIDELTQQNPKLVHSDITLKNAGKMNVILRKKDDSKFGDGERENANKKIKQENKTKLISRISKALKEYTIKLAKARIQERAEQELAKARLGQLPDDDDEDL